MCRRGSPAAREAGRRGSLLLPPAAPAAPASEQQRAAQQPATHLFRCVMPPGLPGQAAGCEVCTRQRWRRVRVPQVRPAPPLARVCVPGRLQAAAAARWMRGPLGASCCDPRCLSRTHSCRAGGRRALSAHTPTPCPAAPAAPSSQHQTNPQAMRPSPRCLQRPQAGQHGRAHRGGRQGGQCVRLVWQRCVGGTQLWPGLWAGLGCASSCGAAFWGPCCASCICLAGLSVFSRAARARTQQGRPAARCRCRCRCRGFHLISACHRPPSPFLCRWVVYATKTRTAGFIANALFSRLSCRA